MVRSKKPERARSKEDDDTGDVLELGALARPPRLVSIEGQMYEMLDVDTLGIGPRARLGKLRQRIDVLEKKGERMKAKEEAEYDGRLLEITKVILPNAPDEITHKMSIGSRQTLVIDFLFNVTLESPRLQTLARVIRSAGSKRSADSNGHTPEEAAGPIGTNGRRSR